MSSGAKRPRDGSRESASGSQFTPRSRLCSSVDFGAGNPLLPISLPHDTDAHPELSRPSSAKIEDHQGAKYLVYVSFLDHGTYQGFLSILFLLSYFILI